MGAVKNPGLARTKGVLHRLTERGLLPMVEEVALAHHVTAEDIASADRSRVVCVARRVVFARLREMGFSLPAIGRLVGRDSSTVYDGLKKVAS